MMKKGFTYALLFFALGLHVLKAQNQAPQNLPAVWDLQGCLDYARTNNITLNRLRLSQQSAGQDLVQARAARHPLLAATVTQSLSNTNTGLNPASGYGVSSDLTLFNAGYLKNDIRQKQLSLQSAALDVLEAHNDITLQITQAYYNIALAKESIVYLTDLVATSAAQVKRGGQMLGTGSIARKDLLQLQAVLASDRYNLVTAGNTERQHKLNLQQLLQLPAEVVFDIAAPDVADTTVAVTPLAQVQQKAVRSRPEIENGELRVYIAQLDLEKARAGNKPSIGLGAILHTSYANNTEYSYAKTLGTNFYEQVGLTLSIPIYNRMITITHVARTKIALAQANLDLKNSRILLLQQVEQAYLQLVNAQSQYTAAKDQLNYTKETFRIARQQLRIGGFHLVEYLQQRNHYVQALQSYLQARYTAALYLKVYDFYNGLPVTQ